MSGAAGGVGSGGDSGGGVWADYSVVDAGASAAWEFESAWIAAAEVSWGRSDSVGGGQRRGGDGRDDDASRPSPPRRWPPPTESERPHDTSAAAIHADSNSHAAEAPASTTE